MLPFIDSARSAGILASEIGGRLSQPYIIDDHKIHMAVSLGMDIAVEPGAADAPEAISRLTDRVGADGVIVTAATPSSS